MLHVWNIYPEPTEQWKTDPLVVSGKKRDEQLSSYVGIISLTFMEHVDPMGMNIPIGSMYGIFSYIYHILPLKTTKCR